MALRGDSVYSYPPLLFFPVTDGETDNQEGKWHATMTQQGTQPRTSCFHDKCYDAKGVASAQVQGSLRDLLHLDASFLPKALKE